MRPVNGFYSLSPVVGGGNSAMSSSGLMGILYFPPSQRPKSINLHRSPQNGNDAFGAIGSSRSETGFLQMGQSMTLPLIELILPICRIWKPRMMPAWARAWVGPVSRVWSRSKVSMSQVSMPHRLLNCRSWPVPLPETQRLHPPSPPICKLRSGSPSRKTRPL